jgi:hypothetical protein
MFYDGPSIFSWGRHWEMARLVTLPDGARGAMLYQPTQGRSVSTSKHFGKVLRACDHLPSFMVQSFDDHEKNYRWFIEQAAELVAKARRAIKHGPFYIDSAQRALDQANGYSLAWQLGHGIVALMNVPGYSGQLAAKFEGQRAAMEARERAAIRDGRASYKKHLREWLAGADCYVPHTARPWCRVNDDKAIVETSWGASVPLEQALTLFRIATKKRAAGEAWSPCGLWAHKVGDFAVRQITRTGDIIVGCHHIPYRAAKLAADRAGIAI